VQLAPFVMMKPLSAVLVAAACIALAGSSAATTAGQKGNGKDPTSQDVKRPKLTLRAQPPITMSPARVVLTGELNGGNDDYEEYYCATVEWDWGDDTRSESTADCEPYEAGKSQIKRRFVVEHVFRRPGMYKVYVHLKRKSKTLTSATVTVQVRSGGPD
jgi:hypothetical protein